MTLLVPAVLVRVDVAEVEVLARTEGVGDYVYRCGNQRDPKESPQHVRESESHGIDDMGCWALAQSGGGPEAFTAPRP